MYGIFTYIWAIYGVNDGKYSSTMEHMGFITCIIEKDWKSEIKSEKTLRVLESKVTWVNPKKQKKQRRTKRSLKRNTGLQTTIKWRHPTINDYSKWSTYLQHHSRNRRWGSIGAWTWCYHVLSICSWIATPKKRDTIYDSCQKLLRYRSHQKGMPSSNSGWLCKITMFGPGNFSYNFRHSSLCSAHHGFHHAKS